jgi:hypothetical protein
MKQLALRPALCTGRVRAIGFSFAHSRGYSLQGSEKMAVCPCLLASRYPRAGPVSKSEQAGAHHPARWNRSHSFWTLLRIGHRWSFPQSGRYCGTGSGQQETTRRRITWRHKHAAVLTAWRLLARTARGLRSRPGTEIRLTTLGRIARRCPNQLTFGSLSTRASFRVPCCL